MNNRVIKFDCNNCGFDFLVYLNWGELIKTDLSDSGRVNICEVYIERQGREDVFSREIICQGCGCCVGLRYDPLVLKKK